MPEKSKYFHDSHSKHLLHVHLIFCVKYRKRLLVTYGDAVKSIFMDVSDRYDFNIVSMQVDKNHIHNNSHSTGKQWLYIQLRGGLFIENASYNFTGSSYFFC